MFAADVNAHPILQFVQTLPGPNLAETLSQIFGNRFYIELQRHGTEAERAAETGLVELAYALDIPLVASNEAYFAKPEDYAAHDALICIAEGEVIAAEDRRRLTPEHYFKPQTAMAALFADIPEAVENTVEIALRCAFRVKPRDPILPRFAEGDEGEELRRQAHEGIEARLRSRGLVGGKSREDYVALRRNGVGGLGTLVLKNLSKIEQFFVR